MVNTPHKALALRGMRTINKPFVIITVIAIIVITLASIGPTVYRALTTPGIKTEAIVADGAAPNAPKPAPIGGAPWFAPQIPACAFSFWRS